MIDLEPHELAKLFPQIPEEELAELGRDIALHGQLEPIVLYQGKILDGVNRYRACRLMDREPWTIEFNQESVKRTPEEYVIAANVRRRHLDPGQRAAIAEEWASQVEQAWAVGRDGGFRRALDETSENKVGRPRSSAIPETSQLMGVSRAAVYQARQVRETNPALFAEVKAGTRSLTNALAQIHPPPAEAEPSGPRLLDFMGIAACRRTAHNRPDSAFIPCGARPSG